MILRIQLFNNNFTITKQKEKKCEIFFIRRIERDCERESECVSALGCYCVHICVYIGMRVTELSVLLY